ncbi:MAG TPA: hypothetical protein V6C85_31300 [Allocoleopsis sp.]
MQQFFAAIGKRIVILGLISLLSLSGVFIFSDRPALAGKSMNRPSNEAVDRAYTLSEEAGLREEQREEAYEEAAEAVNNPKKGIEKIYEEDLKAYKQDNSGGNGLVEGAKNLVDKVTGNE